MQARNFARWFAEHRLVGYVAAGLVGVAALSTSLVASRADTGVTASPTPTPAGVGNAVPPGSYGPALFAGIGGGGANNVVLVVNRQDQTFRFDGKVQINQLQGPSVGPLNLAEGYSSCTNCQTLAVAMQIDLVVGSPSLFQPKNAGIAINFQSVNAHTVGLALQYVIQVADASQIPDRVRQLAQDMNQELTSVKAATASGSISVDQAKGDVLGVINQFQDLAANLKTSMQDETAPTTPGAGPVPTVSGSPTESSTPATSASTSPSTAPTATPSPSTSP